MESGWEAAVAGGLPRQAGSLRRRWRSPRPQPAHFLSLRQQWPQAPSPARPWLEASPKPGGRGSGQSPAGPTWGPWPAASSSALVDPWLPTLVIGGDVDVLPVGLLRGDAPPVDVVGALLLLLRLRPLFLQLLPLVLCPPVLEPHLHLGQGGRGRSKKHPGGSQSSSWGLSAQAELGARWGNEGQGPLLWPGTACWI